MLLSLSLKTCAATLLLALSAAAAELPEMRVEPSTGGSTWHIKNASPEPITAYLCEYVGYPGNFFARLEDIPFSEPIPPGVESALATEELMAAIQPKYLKLQAVLWADGTSAGAPEKVTELIEHRRALLGTTRELIGRLEKAQSAKTPKATLIADLKQWSGTIQPPAKHERYYKFTGPGLNQTDSKRLIDGAATRLGANSLDEVLTGLRATERSLASSKPAL
jgi:hypothetical protein